MFITFQHYHVTRRPRLVVVAQQRWKYCKTKTKTKTKTEAGLILAILDTALISELG